MARRASRLSLVPLAIPAYGKHRWAIIRIFYNYNGNSAQDNRFPVLAEGPEVLLLRNSATNDIMSSGGRGQN
jgi:hypothetical protein